MFQLLVLLFIIKLYARTNIFKYYFILTEDSYHLSIFVLQLINKFISLYNIFTIITLVILW